jgi:nucleotide-binding universal stress UspA family protein
MVKVAHTLLLGKGDPKDVVCREAEEREVDIIVIGRRGLGKFKRCALAPKASGGVAFVRV